MEQQTDISQMLEQMERPAFCVYGGTITYANHAARGRMVQPGQPVAPLLCTGAQEYADYTGGHLYLSVEISSVRYDATVSKLSSADLFVLDPGQTESELKALALAAMELRKPLDSIMSSASQLLPSLQTAFGDQAPEQMAQINRGLYQLLRITNNMSDAASFQTSRPYLDTRELTSVMAEFFDRAQMLCEQANVTLEFTNHPQTIYSMVDSGRLERAIYNILSNALKYTPAGGRIQAKLTRRGSTAYLTIQDTGTGIEANAGSGIFTRYLREPAIEDPRHGIGLGLTLVRAAAAIHGGTVLLEPWAGGVRVTMSIAIRLDNTLHSKRAWPEPPAGYDAGLVELSDCLPAALYGPNKI